MRGRHDWNGRHRNELKVLALANVSTGKGQTPRGLSRDLAISVENAEMVLFRCFRQRLLDRSAIREGFKRPQYLYVITPRGSQKLPYLEEHLEKPKRRRKRSAS